MARLTERRRGFGLAGWLRLPPARARCVGHLFGVAATLAAAKVVLATAGVTLFISERGAAGLPFFYVVFAPLAILLSFGLGSIIDRAPRVRLAQIVFAGLLGGAAALRLLPLVGVDGMGFALLAAATGFEIVLEIVLWVVAAAYLDAFELRRATPALYMGLALGGVAGGLLTRTAAGALAAADLVLLLVPLGALVLLQLQVIADRLDEMPESDPELPEPGAGLAAALQTVRLLRRYPLALLIALNALLATLLYGLSEFLILSIYEDSFADDAELAAFLSLLFATTQIIEFGLLFTLTRALLERTGPLLRNLGFPLTSLGAVGALLVDPRLATAVAAHVNIEALSNALYLPINNANYVALPLSFQGRARTLSEGIFYPIGLALAGAVLWGSEVDGTLLGAEFAALTFALILLLVSAGVGLLFLPTLLVNAQAGLAGVPSVPPGPSLASEPALARVQTLLRSRDPALCLLGLDLARRLEVSAVEDELRTLADRPQPAIRAALARIVTRAPEAWRGAFLEACLSGQTPEAHKLGLLVMLIRRTPASAGPLRLVLGSPDPAVVALGRLVLDGPAAELGASTRDPPVASQLIEAAVSAGRPDLAGRLLGRIDDAEPEQLRRALILIRGAEGRPAPEAEDAARRLLGHRDGRVRAEAIAILGRVGRSGRALRPLAAALRDPDARVRRAAGAALAGHGDRAAALVRNVLSEVTPACVEAAAALARIGSPRARRLLTRTVRRLRADAAHTDRMLGQAAAISQADHRSPLEIALLEHRSRLAGIALAVVLAPLDVPLARHLRSAITSGGQRDRARAFELLAARPATDRLPEALSLLRQLTLEGGTGGGPRPDRGRPPSETAAHSLGPWVRLAAAREAGQESRAVLEHGSPRGAETTMGDDDFERIIVLKRTPLFRDLDLGTLTAVAQAVRTRSWLRGDEVVPAGSARRDLLILESGRLSIDGAPMSAPGCFGEVTLAGETISWPRITALEDSRAGFLAAILFEELQRDHPELLVQLCRHLGHRLRALETRPDRR